MYVSKEEQSALDRYIQQSKKAQRVSCSEILKLLGVLLLFGLMVSLITFDLLASNGPDPQKSGSKVCGSNYFQCENGGVKLCCHHHNQCNISTCSLKPYKIRRAPWTNPISKLVILSITIALAVWIIKQMMSIKIQPTASSGLSQDERRAVLSAPTIIRYYPESPQVDRIYYWVLLFLVLAVGCFFLAMSHGPTSQHDCSHYYPSKPDQCANDDRRAYCCSSGFKSCGDKSSCEVKPDDRKMNMVLLTAILVCLGMVAVLLAYMAKVLT